MGEIYEKGQVVIPKYIRDMFKLTPGTHVNFKVEDSRIVIEPAYNTLEEFCKLSSSAKRSGKETERLIAKTQKKMEGEWLNVH